MGAVAPRAWAPGYGPRRYQPEARLAHRQPQGRAGPARLRQAKMHLAADLFVRPVADREIGPPLRICRGDRPVRLADRKAPPGLVVAEGGPCAMHAERVDRKSTRLNSSH